MRAAVNARVSVDRSKADPQEELRSYLTAPLEIVDDVIAWWGVRS